MDPLTHGLLGAGLAVSLAKKSKIKLAAICGALGAMAPDLDVFIRSKGDPLLAIEFHRHFTHSFAFIPIGALIVAGFWWLLAFRKTQSFKDVYIYTAFGYATHALLDACTSYGTRIYWPFSDERVAWGIVSIIDPVVTFTLLAFLIFALIKHSKRVMIVGMTITMMYLGYGYYKHMQVVDIVQEIAKSRGQVANKILLNPTFGNNILWRSVYEYEGNYYVDAVRVGVLSEPTYRTGAKVPVLNVDEHFPHLAKDSVEKFDIDRFTYFSQGYVYMHPEYDNVIADLRYGTLPFDTKSMWGIKVDENKPNEHVEWKVMRKFTNENYKDFWHMLTESENAGFVNVPK